MIISLHSVLQESWVFERVPRKGQRVASHTITFDRSGNATQRTCVQVACDRLSARKLAAAGQRFLLLRMAYCSPTRGNCFGSARARGSTNNGGIDDRFQRRFFRGALHTAGLDPI
jgi:hypothetical protein